MSSFDEAMQVLAETRSHVDEFLGLTREGADELATRLSLQLRIVEPGRALSADLRPRRMTVTITDGFVTAASAG
jgi:hypothetical protein